MKRKRSPTLKALRKMWKRPERCLMCRNTCGFVPGPNGWVRCVHGHNAVFDHKAMAVKE